VKFPRPTQPWKSECFPAPERGGFGYSSRFETVVVSFTKAVQFMNFPKSLPAIFIGSTAVLCALDKHIWIDKSKDLATKRKSS
jgi:hypothetical protein